MASEHERRKISLEEHIDRPVSKILEIMRARRAEAIAAAAAQVPALHTTPDGQSQALSAGGRTKWMPAGSTWAIGQVHDSQNLMVKHWATLANHSQYIPLLYGPLMETVVESSLFWWQSLHHRC